MNRLVIKYLLLLVAQILLWNYFNFTQFLTIAILPAMILCIPVKKGAVFGMLAAFFTGIAVDFFAGGLLGLTSLALVPVAALRLPVVRLVFGSELQARGEDISFQRQGGRKMALATFIVTAVFLLLFIVAESAGIRPLWVDLVKFAASLAVSTPLSTYITWILCSEDSQRWK